MSNSRRTFFVQSVSGFGAFAATVAHAQAPATVGENDPQALALGYKTDGSTADKAKYPSYNANQSCSGCLLFQGKAGDATAPCAAFGNKLVAGKGWCSAWAKKA
ncbi:MAG: high-potential iron-sulfur protein [Brachymonas sp.]